MAGSNRLLKEYREILKNAEDEKQHRRGSSLLDSIILQPIDDSNLYRWSASILGPSGTPFAHHRFLLNIVVPSSYPHSPPQVTFTTPIAHPNIHPKTGEICLDILKDAWTPIWTIESVCRAIIALLADGDASSPLNCDCGNLIRSGDWRGYWSLARMWTIEYAKRVETDQTKEDIDGWKQMEKQIHQKQQNNNKTTTTTTTATTTATTATTISR